MANEPTELELELEPSEQDVLFAAYFDDELTAEERGAFDERLRDDPEFASAWEEYANFIGAMQSLPFEFAPDHFVGDVKAQIRVRSRDRFFADDPFAARMQFEVVAVVMILVMTVAYLFMGVPADAGLRDVNVPDHAPSLLD